MAETEVMELGADERTCTGVEGTARSSGSSSSSSATEAAVSWMATFSSGCEPPTLIVSDCQWLIRCTQRAQCNAQTKHVMTNATSTRIQKALRGTLMDTDLGLGDSGLELGVNVVKRSGGHSGNGGHGDFSSGALALLQPGTQRASSAQGRCLGLKDHTPVLSPSSKPTRGYRSGNTETQETPARTWRMGEGSTAARKCAPEEVNGVAAATAFCCRTMESNTWGERLQESFGSPESRGLSCTTIAERQTSNEPGPESAV